MMKNEVKWPNNGFNVFWVFDDIYVFLGRMTNHLFPRSTSYWQNVLNHRIIVDCLLSLSALMALKGGWVRIAASWPVIRHWR
jgi:hypothetical protein